MPIGMNMIGIKIALPRAHLTTSLLLPLMESSMGFGGILVKEIRLIERHLGCFASSNSQTNTSCFPHWFNSLRYEIPLNLAINFSTSSAEISTISGAISFS